MDLGAVGMARRKRWHPFCEGTNGIFPKKKKGGSTVNGVSS
jgi:hypothetical protein